MPSVLAALFLVHGSAGATTPLYGEDIDDRFGTAVSGAGDVDGDGFDDFLVGAPGDDLNTGRVSLYLGTATGPSLVPALVLYGDPLESGPYGTLFGANVTRAGDVNGDGYDDVAITAEGPGHVRVYHGGPGGLSATAATLIDKNRFYGTPIAAAGDTNGDGYDDLLVGSRGDGHYQATGRASVHLGGPTGIAATAAITWSGGTDYFLGSEDYQFGRSISGAGDTDGDGFDDVLVTWEGLGEVHLYAGSPTGPGAVPAVVWTNPTHALSTVYVVAGAGDTNGDGFDDVIVGSWDDGGRVVQFLGSASGAELDPSRVVSFPSPTALSAAGDVNGDGFDDVILASYYIDSQRGRAEILVGSPNGLRRDTWGTLAGGYTEDRLGWSVSGAGDTNGDGFDDVIVGAPLADTTTGRAVWKSGHTDLVVRPIAASISGGVEVEVTEVTPRDRVTVFAGPARSREIVGYAVAGPSGEVRVTGPLPASATEGSEIELVAVASRRDDGWLSSDRGAPVDVIVTP